MGRVRRSLSFSGLALLAWLASGASAHAIAVPDGARAEGAFDDGDARVEARLLIHPDDAPGSGGVRAGVLL